MREAILIAFLIFSCLALISPIVSAFSGVSFNHPPKLDLGHGLGIIRAIAFQPEDPGSGGGSTGVIK
jgi:hypothetical protein